MPVVGSAPSWGIGVRFGSGIPSDASGNLGDRYFDTTAQRWYLKRWVGKFAGADRVTNPKKYIGATGPFSFEMLINCPVGVVNYPTFMSGNVPDAGSVAVQGNAATNQISFVQPIVGVFLSPTQAALDDKWHKIFGSRDASGIYSMAVDGNSPVTASPIGLDVAPVSFSVGAFVGAVAQQLVGMIASVKINGFGNALIWDFSDGSGSLVRDISGNGNNGTLTDGAPTNFWYQSWVPMDLL